MTLPKRALAVTLAALAVIAIGTAALWRGGQQSPSAAGEPVRPQAPPPVAARLTAIYPEPGGPAIVTVRLFNQSARQAAATNTALDVAASTAPREAVNPVEVSMAPGEWGTSVQFRAPGGAAVAASDVRVVARPDAAVHVLGAAEAVHARFELSPAAIALLDGRVTAVVTVGDWQVTSNAAVLAAPADLRDRRIQRARAAEASGDIAALTAAAEALIDADAADPWGHWYRGLAREASGDRAGALEAYHAAASRLSPASGSQEPPVDLFRRIAALRQN